MKTWASPRSALGDLWDTTMSKRYKFSSKEREKLYATRAERRLLAFRRLSDHIAVVIDLGRREGTSARRRFSSYIRHSTVCLGIAGTDKSRGIERAS